MNIAEKKKVMGLKKRIRRLVDERKVAISAIALKSGVEVGTIKAIYEEKEFSKRTIADSTARKIEKGLDAQETDLGMVKTCSKCGKRQPIGKFYERTGNKDGLMSYCKDCAKSMVAESKKKSRKPKENKKPKEENVNNNTENAVTAEIVQRVKREDQPEVDSRLLAPYFKVTPKQLDDIRAGKWDKLLLTPKQPPKAESVLASVESLRGEVALLRRELEAVLMELGVSVEEFDAA